MAQYNVQDPQGRMRVIEGPDGATDDEVIAQAKRLFGESGAMAHPAFDNSRNKQLDTIRQYLTPGSVAANAAADILPAPMAPIKSFIHAAFPPDTIQSPQASFNQDVRTGNAQDTTVPDLMTAQAVITAPSALRAIGEVVDAGAAKALNYLKTLKNARSVSDAFLPTESAMEAGNTIALSKGTEEAANKTTADLLFSKAPKDTSLPIKQGRNTADTIINEIKDLPKSVQSAKIRDLASDIQEMDKASLPAMQAIQSKLKDVAKNGEGMERVWAAKLSDALHKDLEAFGRTPVIQKALSQGNSLEAQALREKWVKAAEVQNNIDDVELASTLKSFQKPGASGINYNASLTNSDIPQALSKANSYYRDMMSLKNSPLSKALDRASMESKANIIFKSGKIDDINGAKALLGDEGYKAAQDQFYGKLANSKTVGKTLEKYSPEFLDAAIGPARVKALKDLAHFHKLVDAAKKAALAVTGVSSAYGAYKYFQ